MDFFGLEFTIYPGVADLFMAETFRHLLDYLVKGQISVVGFMVFQTIRVHVEVHVHTVRLVHNKLAHGGTVVVDAELYLYTLDKKDVGNDAFLKPHLAIVLDVCIGVGSH